MKLSVTLAMGIATLSVLSLPAAVGTVSNVSMPAQDNASRAVTVNYDLSGADSIVTVDFLTNGVSIGSGNIRYLTGDVNRKVAAGTGKRIVWQPHKSWPGHKNTVTAVVTAWDLDAPPNYMVIDLNYTGVRTYYVSEDALPEEGGITNRKYKTEYLVMRKIPAAGVTFNIGSPSGEPGKNVNGWADSRERFHRVQFTNDWYMAVYPLTSAQMKKFKPSYGLSSNYQNHIQEGVDIDTCPVTDTDIKIDTLRGTSNVWPTNGSVVDSDSYMQLFRTKTGLRTMDLPTEARWEYSCRAGSAANFNVGETIDPSSAAGRAAYDEIGYSALNSGSYLYPVGEKKPNAWGLYNCHGPVRELCKSHFINPYVASADVVEVDPPGGDASQSYITRGGSTENVWEWSRCAARHATANWQNLWSIGIRLMCEAGGND